MDTISYDEFSRLDIRVGTIVQAEIVPEADRLLKLNVSFGEEVRQIVSGIRDYFPEPEVLIGVQCPFLVNLAPRVIKGLESQGMILAVDENPGFALLQPSVEVQTGAKVR
jgi:methionyl-tRNA synthetase